MSFLVRKKQTNHSESESGHYYISISDLMTSLLFIFILILVYVMLSFVQKEEMLNKEVQKLEKNIESRSNLLVELQKDLKSQGINIDIDEKNGNMRLKSDVLFESASAELKDEGKRQISEIAKLLVVKMNQNEYKNAIDTIFIEGHTDNIPIRSSKNCRDKWTNKELSSQRAINTFVTMIYASDKKIKDLENIKGKKLISYSGYADTRPLCIENTKECRDKNRRIEFYFTVNTPNLKNIKEKMK